MTVSHRAAAASASSAAASHPSPLKVARVACCCRLADLLPMVQQMHREVARRSVSKAAQSSEAA
ncbi:hypothetical protein Hsw_0671 [Hymenobacter swuensis DY53]|uniref:Uncharacterized protein n=1 Tax=Hymenobacter swuensis DY53 TaxID=1227739 RepID=W8F0Z8_9BACT|nr:hypothetical protein Hsw_0671 [Hymenobacter swuensis DY53]